MKKYILLFATAIAMAFSSCTNDNVVEIKDGEVTFQINIQSLYDEFESTDSVKDLLRNKEYAIAVTSLIYDKDGSLVDYMTTYSYDFNSVQHHYGPLVTNEYTAVFYETFVSVENELKPYAYELSEIGHLSTLNIKVVDTNLYWYEVIGINYCDFTSNGNIIQVKPEAIGSEINCYFFGFDKSEYVNVGVGAYEMLNGYKLDPTLSHGDRCLYDLDQSGYFSLLGSTSVESEQEVFSMYVMDENLTYHFVGQDGDQYEDGKWTPYESFSIELKTAEIIYMGFAYKDGKYYHDYFDNKDDLADWYFDLYSGYTPSESIIPDLYMTWGGTVNSVQNAMSDYEMYIGDSGKAEDRGDGSYMLGYYGEGLESNILYEFTSKTTGLVGIYVYYSKENVTSAEILDILNLNYIYLDKIDDMYMYSNDDGSTIVALMEFDDVWSLAFFDANYLVGSLSIDSSITKSSSVLHNNVYKLIETRKNSVN